MKSELYIGLAVHSEVIAVAVAEGGRTGEVRELHELLRPPKSRAGNPLRQFKLSTDN